MQNNPLGYVVCKTCLTPKAIYQGTGKRQNFVYGRCACGLDNRTGKAIQTQLKAFKPLDDIEAELTILNQPVEIANQSQSEPQSAAIPEPNPPESVPQPAPQSEPQSQSHSEPVGMMACVGIGSLIGLVFGGVIKSMKAIA